MATFCHKMREWAQRGTEQRRAGRFRCELLHTNLGDVIDMSATGMRIQSRRRPVRPNVTLTIRTLDDKVRVRARIVRVVQQDKRSWELGVQFVNLSPELHERLNEIGRYAAIRRAVGPGTGLPRQIESALMPAEEGCEGLRDFERGSDGEEAGERASAESPHIEGESGDADDQTPPQARAA